MTIRIFKINDIDNIISETDYKGDAAKFIINDHNMDKYFTRDAIYRILTSNGILLWFYNNEHYCAIDMDYDVNHIIDYIDYQYKDILDKIKIFSRDNKLKELGI